MIRPATVTTSSPSWTSASVEVWRLYDLYTRHGRTANHATWNWFGRADSWTEPCAMVDSLILALGLWRTTRDRRYLDDAEAIELNGLGHAQKPHGGFGLDSITGPGLPWLRNVHPDAAWCCTMRGAVGLAEVWERRHSVATGGASDILYVDLYRDGDARLELGGGEMAVRQRTRYPYEGATTLDVLHSTVRRQVEIRFHLPSWTDAGRARVTGGPPGRQPGRLLLRPAAGDRYGVDFPVALRAEPADSDGGIGVRMLHGPLLLAATDDDAHGSPDDDAPDPGRARHRHRGAVLRPVREVFHTTPGRAARYHGRVVFDDP
ncbi:MAG: hypothetical protein HOW59_39160 [Nonomuraea sp.]|nr:hypothetical protein [Nonomuraea sp.]